MLRKSRNLNSFPIAPDIYRLPGFFRVDENGRSEIGSSCHDCDYIPKVKNAGNLKKVGSTEYQIMHNGLLVERHGYNGEMIERIIKNLRGHHEPQEEKVFFEILKRVRSNANMIEHGSFWAFYSMWFMKDNKNRSSFCFEPSPENLSVGQRNALANNIKLSFKQAASGSECSKTTFIPENSQNDKPVEVDIIPVDKTMDDEELDYLDILHLDVQGAELDSLLGAQKTIKNGKLRFLVLSTHHHTITGDPLTHKRCLEFIGQHGGNIVAEHTIPESFSGDGLIVASFRPEDKDFKVEISYNRASNCIYRSTEEDLANLSAKYEELRLS
jgi:FkbM family methyltransferase